MHGNATTFSHLRWRSVSYLKLHVLRVVLFIQFGLILFIAALRFTREYVSGNSVSVCLSDLIVADATDGTMNSSRRFG